MVKAKKYLGQHFLNDKNIASKIANMLVNNDKLNVLEIGPGTGILTNELINLGHKLTLIEIDKESVEFLNNNYENKFILIEGDFIKLNLKDIFDGDFCIIGNFPYNISSQIFFKILDNRDQIPEIVCMIQKEVAERISAKHGNKTYGILSVLLQLFFKIEYLFTVSENVFLPPPKVKSAVIRLTRYRSNIDTIDIKKLILIVKTAFNQRRKKLSNSLSNLLIDKSLKDLPIFQLRPEQLSPEDFIELTKIVSGLL